MFVPTVSRAVSVPVSGSCLMLMLPMLAIAEGLVLERVAGAEPEQHWGEPLDLLQGDLSVSWEWFSVTEEPPVTDVWKLLPSSSPDTTELVCSGTPRGFLHTKKQYRDFDLQFEWRYASDPNGNSGVLVFTQDDARLWPTSVQIQLHQPLAGSVFPVGDAVTDATVRKEGLARSVGEWNQCRIVSLSGTVVVHINGVKAGEVSGCRPDSGAIAIQSEGSEVHFRRMLLRLPRTSAPENAQ